jgi:hypothetical protein
VLNINRDIGSKTCEALVLGFICAAKLSVPITARLFVSQATAVLARELLLHFLPTFK